MTQDLAKSKGMVRSITRTYILALIMLLTLLTATFFSFQYAKREHESSLRLLNTTSSLQIELQRTVLLSQNLATPRCAGIEINFCRGQLLNSVQTLRHHYKTLVNDGTDSSLGVTRNSSFTDAFEEFAPDLIASMIQFMTTIQHILDDTASKIEPNDTRINTIIDLATGQLMVSLEQLTLSHQREVNKRFQTFSIFQTLFFAFSLLLLILQAVMIFRPLFARLKAQLEELTHVKDQLTEHNHNLESAVLERTQELEEARQEAVEANHSKSRFLAQAGHDLLQPVEAMSMLISLLKKDIGTKRGETIYGDVTNTLTSMKRLVRAVLDISKLEAGVITPNIQPIALAPIFSQLRAEFTPIAQKKSLELEILNTELVVESDPMLLERILRNLLTNAIRYTPEGRVLVGIRHPNHQPEIWVCDTGKGIPTSDYDTIFQEFTQLVDDTRDRSEGIGLGLSIVKRLCSLLDHKITLASQEGCGTIFKLKLKVSQSRPSQHHWAA